MQINRLFEIVYLLIDRKRMTAAELAGHFEVSVRTILRDVESLSAAGIPLYTVQGRGGGIAIMEGFVLNKALLTEAEQNQILFALQGMSAAQNTLDRQVLDKIQSLFQKSNTSWIEVDFSRWGAGAYDKNKFELLKNAILGRRTLCFTYVSSNGGETRRSVYPLKLVFKSRAWYLQGFCLSRRDYRSFKVSRMLELCETGENFSGEYSPPPIDGSGPPPSASKLLLEFAPHVAYRVYDEFDEGSIERDDEGYLRVRAAMPEDDWLFRYLRSFGNDVRVISPKRLAEKLAIT